jgi:hypothetical protein
MNMHEELFQTTVLVLLGFDIGNRDEVSL